MLIYLLIKKINKKYKYNNIMSQQRYLQQLRSNIQPSKEAAISAIKSQLNKANDGSFILGRYLDGVNGIRTIIGVNASIPSMPKNITIFEVDGIEFSVLQERLHTIEKTIGIGEGSEGNKSIIDRVKELEQMLADLKADKTNVNSIDYKIYQSELKLIGDKFTDNENSETIEGAKKYADKAIELALNENGSIEKAIKKAADAATTKVAVGTDPNNVMSISSITNLDNSTTYEISLADIAVQSELDEVKEFIGMTEGGEGSTSIIERIEAVDDRITNEVDTLNQKIQKNTDAITVLNGTGDGSVHKTVSDAITELINGADTAYDTLKEISDYIANDTINGAQMANDINDLKKSVNALNNINVVSCEGSDLIKVSTSITHNSDSKEEKTFVVCANNIASTTDVNNVKTELTNKINSTNEKINKEITDRQTADNSLDSKINSEVTRIDSEIDTLESKISVLTGNSESSISGQIDAAVKILKGDATTSGDNLGLIEDRIEQLEKDVNTEGGHVNTLVKTSIEALDYTDTPKLNEFVYGVNQVDGKISVTREFFGNAIVTTEGESLTTVIAKINKDIENAEISAKAAATKVTVSGNDMLSKTESINSSDGSTTYDLNLSNVWDCGEFEYNEPEG